MFIIDKKAFDFNDQNFGGDYWLECLKYPFAGFNNAETKVKIGDLEVIKLCGINNNSNAVCLGGTDKAFCENEIVGWLNEKLNHFTSSYHVGYSLIQIFK